MRNIPITIEDLCLKGNFTVKEKEAIYREVTKVIILKQLEDKLLSKVYERKSKYWWQV